MSSSRAVDQDRHGNNSHCGWEVHGCGERKKDLDGHWPEIHKKNPVKNLYRVYRLAPREGLEPPTGWLTATCSTN